MSAQPTVADAIADLADSQAKDLQKRVNEKLRQLRAQVDAVSALNRLIMRDLRARLGVEDEAS